MTRYTEQAGKTAQIEIKWLGAEIKRRARRLKTKSIMEIGIVVMNDAKQLCAVNYGYLAASIQAASNLGQTFLDEPGEFSTEQPPAKHDVKSFKDIAKPNDENEVLVGTAVDYAPYVEYGTIKMYPQPFLRPALDMAKGRVLAIVRHNGKNEFGEYLEEHAQYLQSRGYVAPGVKA